MSYSKISNYCTIGKTSLTGERQITLVPAALSDSYEDITILPVIDCFQKNYAENIAVSIAIKNDCAKLHQPRQAYEPPMALPSDVRHLVLSKGPQAQAQTSSPFLKDSVVTSPECLMIRRAAFITSVTSAVDIWQHQAQGQ